MSDEKLTSTERLRQLLDERGVEWWPMHDVETGYREDRDTEFIVNGCKHVAHEWGRGLQVDMLTPEQAVEATLGRGTCKVVSKPCDMWECECGKAWWHGGAPNYCPNCGRRVEQ